MKQFAAILILASGFAYGAGAQNFLGKLREKKQGEGTVTVNQSAAIDELVNNARLTIQPGQQPQTPPPVVPQQHHQVVEQYQQQRNDNDSAARKAEHHAATPKKETREEATREQRGTTSQPDVETELNDLANVKKVPRVNRKVTGYRVQAFAGGNSRADREKAENIKNKIKARYPELPVYVHFYSPRWICRVGNFRTFEEASAVLRNIKAMGYRQACIVKGKISVGY